MDTHEQILELLGRLTGEKIPLNRDKNLAPEDLFLKGGIGYSQFNEMLLSLGYDRVTRDFFDHVFAAAGHSTAVQISTLEELIVGTEKFRSQSLLLYGNVKYGFKTLSCLEKAALEQELKRIYPIPKEVYENRHKPLYKLTQIPAEDTYYLGYIVYGQIRKQLELDPNNPKLLEKEKKILEIRKHGKRNHDIYLTYDHMDVYVATSMRERHEYYLVNKFIDNLFTNSTLAPLNLRYFDPTQAYCEDRLDKGLVEGLMLKRAKCTIYHAQETDTLGKDSELATTLAQGKPVIAYVPRLSDMNSFITGAIALSDRLYPGLSTKSHLQKLLRLYDPDSAWNDTEIREWLSDTANMDEQKMSEIVYERAKNKYEARAKMLSEDHPLGLQMNLSTGVANGVLVVRSISQCAELLRRVMLNEMEFSVVESRNEGKPTFLLKEKISGCVFRAMTGDELLTNSFWNFYLKENSYQGSVKYSKQNNSQLRLELTREDLDSYP